MAGAGVASGTANLHRNHRHNGIRLLIGGGAVVSGTTAAAAWLTEFK
jgi:hypothetical protein